MNLIQFKAWKSNIVLLLIGACISYSTLSHAHTRPSLTVHTRSGDIRGKATEHTDTWQGIPYATPPVGALRWRATQPPHPWKGVKNTTAFGPACWQTPPKQGPESALRHQTMSEDCLTLNIWKPKRVFEEQSLPVMVWIHGGGFRLGSSSMPLYNGANLAQKGVIVVSMNYRLGAFGVFPQRKLSQAQPNQPMNFGIMDQIQALRWIHNNIAAFGGNPDNVTIWGESAGGASVGYLLTSPLSKGLFNKAIIESGALSLLDKSRHQAIKAFEQALPSTINNMSPAALRKLPAKTLLHLPINKTSTMPIVDGRSITHSTRNALQTGKIHHIPLLIGSNNDEAQFFPPAWSEQMKDKLGSMWPYALSLTDGYGTQQEHLKAVQLATDVFATLPTRQFAQTTAMLGIPTWRYYFTYQSTADHRHHVGAIHTSEIPYVFGNLDQLSYTPTMEDKELADNLMERWVHFAKHGNPDPIGFAHWPQYTPYEKTLWQISHDGERAIKERGLVRLDWLAQQKNLSIQ
ncbi:carboxylesterase/lipase family protein [Vibrio palustris]|uniref:Carboxylic ester hydrolase n=1 Tax=Vibrio palustris TaxID=1918946 RepID=A0A1R4B111_9VIBR|nr:carboxylesterase family protein [Vibrio palustris]SJL82594.1 Para-nitrobenzyl esterase [Vibrio palustris]